jgi:AAA domain
LSGRLRVDEVAFRESETWEQLAARSAELDAVPFAEGVVLPAPLTPEEWARTEEEVARELPRSQNGASTARGRSPKVVKLAKAAPSARRLVATPLADIAMRSIEWFERPLWQRSAFQLLAGAKGSGKGTYLAGLAARITRTERNVVFVTSEDSAGIDFKPRLVAADADGERCYLIQQHLKLPDDIDELRDLAHDIGDLGLLVIDPVANHIGDRNSHNDAEVRDAIAPLNPLADELDCLLIGVRHPGKDRSRGAVASILGSVAWVDTPRAVVMIAADDEDPLVRHIQVVVGNRSLNGNGQMFRIDAVHVEGLAEPITVAVPLGESAKHVDDLLAAKQPERGAPVPDEAIQELILRELAEGERSLEQLKQTAADELGAAPNATYERGVMPLKDDGKIASRKLGMNGGWRWRLC